LYSIADSDSFAYFEETLAFLWPLDNACAIPITSSAGGLECSGTAPDATAVVAAGFSSWPMGAFEGAQRLKKAQVPNPQTSVSEHRRNLMRFVKFVNKVD
jgi:hypothetical protein